jgi:hypothetical protein
MCTLWGLDGRVGPLVEAVLEASEVGVRGRGGGGLGYPGG